MAYIGGTETVSTEPTYVVELGTGMVTISNAQSNVLHFDSSYKSYANINVDTTTTLVGTNNYYIVGDVTVKDTKTWDVAGTGTLNVI